MSRERESLIEFSSIKEVKRFSLIFIFTSCNKLCWSSFLSAVEKVSEMKFLHLNNAKFTCFFSSFLFHFFPSSVIHHLNFYFKYYYKICYFWYFPSISFVFRRFTLIKWFTDTQTNLFSLFTLSKIERKMLETSEKYQEKSQTHSNFLANFHRPRNTLETIFLLNSITKLLRHDHQCCESISNE